MHARDALPSRKCPPSSPPGSTPHFVTTGRRREAPSWRQMTRWSMLTGRVQLGPTSALRSPMDRRVIGERSDAVLRTAMPGDDELFRCRDAPSHPSFATPRKAKPRKHSKKPPPLKEGRRSAEKRTNQEPHRQAMRRAPSLLSSHCGRTEAQDFIEPWTSKNGAGALAFRRPTAASEVFGLGSAQAALPGTTGCKREDPLRHQCSEHLAVRHAPDGTMPKPPVSAVYGRARREPLPLRLKEYPRERRCSRT